MNNYTLDMDRVVHSIMLPRPGYIEKLIMKNNKSFSAIKDISTGLPVVSCENKPEDSLLFGIKWIEKR